MAITQESLAAAGVPRPSDGPVVHFSDGVDAKLGPGLADGASPPWPAPVTDG